MLSLKPCSAQKRSSKKAFFILCTGPCSCAFGFQCEKGPVLAAAPPKLFHPPLLCGLGSAPSAEGQGEPPPGSSSAVTRGRTPGPGGDCGEGEVCGSRCLCWSCRAHPVKTLVQDVRALRDRWCATWAEGKACLEACHTA